MGKIVALSRIPCSISWSISCINELRRSELRRSGPIRASPAPGRGCH